MSLYRNTAIFVIIILVEVYPMAQYIHGSTSGMA